MPIALGYVGDPAHEAVISRLVELEQWYRQEATDRYATMVEDWRLYLGQKKADVRKDKEKKWRADVRLPYPYSMTETLAAVIVDIMTSADPFIQIEGVGPEDARLARGMERVLDKSLVNNRWPLVLGMATREKIIQGTQPLKVLYRDSKKYRYFRPAPQEIQKYQEIIKQVMALTGGKLGMPPADPVEHETWRMNFNLNHSRQMGLEIPPLPVDGWQLASDFQGPWIERTSIFDLRFPLKVDPLSKLPIVMHRIIKSKRWLASLTGPEPWKPFDEKQVADCVDSWDKNAWSEWQDEIDQMMGISSSQKLDPYHEDDVELFEVWEPDDPIAPFKVMLNRQAIINKDCNMPYGHSPFIWTRNVPIANQWLGMSEYQQSRRLFHEADTLRSLRLDAVMLQVLPIFVKTKQLGMTEGMKNIRPGMVLEAAQADSIKQLLEMPTQINDAFREINELKGDVDETAGTGGPVRGNAATVGRVTGTEFQGRLNQAMVRSKDRVVRAEEELFDLPKQMLSLLYQFGPEEIITNAAGDNILSMIPRERLQDALDWDVRFRGASKVLNRDIHVQQLKDVLATAGALAVQGVQPLTLEESRTILVKILETMGQKGVHEIITPKGTEELLRLQQWQAMQAQMQAELEQAAAAQEQEQAEGQAAGPGGNGQAAPVQAGELPA